MATYWERREDPTTWTTIDNTPIDDDLSDQALGLLVRWLRRPAGVPLDSIRTMCERDRRAGKTQTNGRSARETQANELERKGYLVRRRWQGERGQWHTTISIGAVPVPPEQRSNPDDRKRAPKKAKTGRTGTTETRQPGSGATRSDDTKPQVAPKPDSRGSVRRGSVRRASFLSHSVKDSLPGNADAPPHLDPSAEDVPEEREQGDQAVDGVPQQREHQEPAAPPAEAVAFAEGLPGRLGRQSVLEVAVIAAEAVAEGWSWEALGDYLRSRVDAARAYAPATLYVKHLVDRPAPPSSASAGRRTAPPECPRHPGFVEGDCSPCRAAERDRARRGKSDPGPISGAALLARVRAGQPAQPA